MVVFLILEKTDSDNDVSDVAVVFSDSDGGVSDRAVYVVVSDMDAMHLIM
jgi:hypothetical protein